VFADGQTMNGDLSWQTLNPGKAAAAEAQPI
jgi:hypothetical protein